jgi:hypothetical protein
MFNAWALAIVSFVGVLASLELGHRIGQRERARGGADGSRGMGAIEGAVFALLGLLLAFSFSGAATRFEARRHLITSEVNAIGTAWLRLDLLPVAEQPQLRTLFRNYTELRSSFFKSPIDEASVSGRKKVLTEIRQKIWERVLNALHAPSSPTQTPILLVPALNAMFDIAETRLLATENHPPPIISTLLIGMTYLAATLAGYGMGGSQTRNRFHRILFALVMTLTLTVITDLEYPRRGLIRVDPADEALVRLATSFRTDR